MPIARLMSASWVFLSPPQSKTARTSPRCMKIRAWRHC